MYHGATGEREVKSLGIPDGLFDIAIPHELRDFPPICEPRMRDRDNCEEEASFSKIIIVGRHCRRRELIDGSCGDMVGQDL